MCLLGKLLFELVGQNQRVIYHSGMPYLCCCADGSNALLLRPTLFHKEQTDTYPLVYVRWKIVGDDLPSSYSDWTESVMRKDESHLMFQPLSDHHPIIAEFRESPHEPWSRCPVVRVLGAKVRASLYYPPGIMLNRDETVQVVAYALNGRGERCQFVMSHQSTHGNRSQVLQNKLFTIDPSCIGYVTTTGEIHCCDPTAELTVHDRYPISYEVVAPEPISVCGDPVRIAAFTKQEIIDPNLLTTTPV